jgi:hypothetical protein
MLFDSFDQIEENISTKTIKPNKNMIIN